MANYVFNAAKELLMKGHINLTTADFDGSTITAGSDDTHNNLASAGAEFRVLLIKSGSSLTTAGETNGSIDAIDCATMDDITTLNECQSSNYTPFNDASGSGTGGESDGVLASMTVTKVDEGDGASYTKWDAADVTFNNIGSGSTIEGFLIVWSKATPTNAGSNAGEKPANATSQIPLVWIDISSNPITTNGGDIEIVWASDGIMRLNA